LTKAVAFVVAAAILSAVLGDDGRASATATSRVSGGRTSATATSSKTKCAKPRDPIAIRSVQISEDPIRAGTIVSGTVLATCNVAAVTAQIGTYRIGVPKTSPGVFQTTVDVPHFLWPGHFTLVVTAIRTDGATVQTSVPIELRW
jgi:hypothetical protein